MKIFGYEITSGPNWQFYAVTAFFAYVSYANETPWPILWWAIACVVMIPLCLLLHKWNTKQNEKMLRDFPNDPVIQDKYRKKLGRE